MTEEEVTKVIGKPDREIMQGTLKLLSYYSRGFELWILPKDSPRHGLYGIVCLGQHGFAVKIREFQGNTDKGIGLGANRSDIIKAYGAPDIERASGSKDVSRKETANAEAVTGQTELVYSKLKLTFALFNGKVYRMMIEAPRPEPVKRK